MPYLSHRYYLVRQVVIAGVFIAVLLLSFSKLLVAESIEYIGLTFEVDELVELDNNYIKVSFDNQEFILDKENYKYEIAEVILTSSLRDKFSVDQLNKFAVNALRAKDGTNSSLLGFRAALEHSKISENKSDDIIKTIFKTSKSLELTKSLLTKGLSNYYAFSALVMSLVDTELLWVRENLTKHLHTQQRFVTDYLQKKVYTKIASSDFSGAKLLISRYENLYGSNNPKFLGLKTQIYKIELTLEKLRAGILREAYPLFDSISGTAGSVEFKRHLVDMLNKEARDQIDDKNYSLALHTLALVYFRYRTPETHLSVKKALESLEVSGSAIWKSSRTDTFLIALANKDPEVQKAYIDFLERKILYHIESSKTETDLVETFNKLILVRPDPNQQNQDLRVSLILDLHKQGRSKEAQRILGSFKTPPSIVQKLQLFVVGVYVHPIVVVLIVSVPFILVCLLYLYVRAQYSPKKQIESLRAQPRIEMSNMQRQFARKEGLDPRIVEYLNLLQSLDLDDKASVKEIKSAYRNKVKTLHPDLRQTTSDITQDFVKLKAVYERILELREELGLS